MPEDFEFFTEKDKKDTAYGVCVLGVMGVGGTLGGLAGGMAAPGAVVGLIWGLLACPKLSYPLKKKLFSANQKLSEYEVANLVTEIRRQNYMGNSQGIKALAQVRIELSKNPGAYKKHLTV